MVGTPRSEGLWLPAKRRFAFRLCVDAPRILGPAVLSVLLVASALTVSTGFVHPRTDAAPQAIVAELARGSGLIPPGAAVPTCMGETCHHPAPAPLLARSLSSLGSTASNWLVANWSGEGMIAENPADPLNLVSGGLYQYPSASNNTTAYYQSGVSGVFTSWDGGRQWRAQTLPSNPNWFNTSSSMCNQLHLADTAIAFGPKNTVYYVDLSDAIGGVTGCTVPTATTGLYSTVSTDGGNTWGTPVPLRGTVAGAFFDKPWIAVDPVTGEAYVTYNDDVNSTLDLQNSTDGGRTWSPPVQLAPTGGSPLGTEVVVDPSGGVDVSWVDVGTGAIYFVRSTDHGATFTTALEVESALSGSSSPAPDSFRAYTLPALGVDAYPGNAYTGALFLVWQNGSGGLAGNPKVSLAMSLDNGSTWSSPIQVNSDTQPQDYQPSVAVGPDGTVYVDWYAVNHVSGHYRLAGALSHNGGRSFDRQFNVSDSDSYPYTKATGSDWWIGDYTHTIADKAGARPLWTDARSPLGYSCSTGACIWGYVYNISFYTGLLVNDSLSASIPTNLSLGGTVAWAGTVPLSPSPTPADWMVGQVYNLTAPPTATYNGTSYSIAYWYGNSSQEPVIYNTSTALNGSVVGGEHIAACYVASPETSCHAPGAPGFLQLVVSPSNASVSVNGVPMALPLPSHPWVEAPGAYSVNLSAPLYYDLNQTVVVTPGNTTVAYLNLTHIQGDLIGSVTPVTAVVKVNGTPIPVASDGSFSVTLYPGMYTVTATAPLYYTYTNPTVRILSGQHTQLALALAGFPGWINGTVSPASASLAANGVAASVGADGSFSLHVAPGTYWLNASKPGWSGAASGPVVMAPFGSSSVNLVLTEYLGTIAGIVAPGNATLALNTTPLVVNQGGFSVNLAPGGYWLNGSAWSYSPVALWILVAANVTVPLSIVLNLSSGWIRGTIAPAGVALSLDGQVVAVATDGTFNVSAPAGTHGIVASAPGYTSQNVSVVVDPGRASVVSVSLVPLSSTGTSFLASSLTVGALILVAALALAGVVIWYRRRSRPPDRPPPT
ncbi:MAG TPA: PEGA domain-containing protein [Thermoplasmata archaeon]|nr:PEGA domain-containing protein [Thermoplasmata archaeon]